MKKTLTIILFFIFLCPGEFLSQWIIQPTDTTNHLRGVYFPNSNSGMIAAGGVEGGSKVLITTNAGMNWTIQSGLATSGFHDVCFVDQNTCIIVGFFGRIFQSTNFGENWTQQITGTTSTLTDVFFVNSNLGYVLGGSSNILLRTTNGGGYWEIYSIGIFGNGIYFVNQNRGMIVGSMGSVLKTTNGGQNWITQNSGTSNTLSDVILFDENDGIAVGNLGTIIKTTNGGLSWSMLNSGTSINLTSIFLIDEQNCTVTGNSGTILKTTNRGLNWSLQASSTNNLLNNSYFVDLNNGIIVGNYGTILKTTNGGITFLSPISSIIPIEYTLFQNFPNPFNPETKIKFQLKDKTNTVIKIYDAIGNEVTTLVNDNLNPGTYETIFDGENYPSGIYFYTLQTEKYSETKKMILIK